MLRQHGLLSLLYFCVAVQCGIIPKDVQLNQDRPLSPNISTRAPEPATTFTSISSTTTSLSSWSRPSTPTWTPPPTTPRVCADSCRFKATLNITGGYQWTSALIDPQTLEYRELKARVTCELGKLYKHSDKLAQSFNWVEVDHLSPGCIKKDFSDEWRSPPLEGGFIIVDYYIVFGDENTDLNPYLTPNGSMPMNSPSDSDRMLPEGFSAIYLKDITMELMEDGKLGSFTIDTSYNDFIVVEPFEEALCGDSCSFAATLNITKGHRWTNELFNPQTLEYEHLKDLVTFELSKLYRQSDKLGQYFNRVEVEVFSPGFIKKDHSEELESSHLEGDCLIVDYYIVFGYENTDFSPYLTPNVAMPMNSPCESNRFLLERFSATNLKEITMELMEDGKLGAFTIDPSYNVFFVDNCITLKNVFK